MPWKERSIVLLYPQEPLRMLCGAQTTRANSCWGIRGIVTPLPFPITPAVTFALRGHGVD
jgi:hypothetical protein